MALPQVIKSLQPMALPQVIPEDHLTPGPCIYYNTVIHVYSPRAGADKPLGTNVDVNRKPLLLCPFIARFKTISLKYDFKHIFNYFISVYSPGARTDNHLGTNFWCLQKALITLPICCRFKQNCFQVRFYIHFFSCFTICTPQPLYNTIVGVQTDFRVSYPNRVITRVKCIC